MSFNADWPMVPKRNPQTPILTLTKRLTARPSIDPISSVVVREFCRADDIDYWLNVHNVATQQDRKGRRWNHDDFRREFRAVLQRIETPSDADRRDMIWFAEPAKDIGTESIPVGTVSCRLGDKTAVLNWLAVLPAWRRQGIAGRLLRSAEQFAWDSQRSVIELTTLATWTSAIQFYSRHGYRPT